VSAVRDVQNVADVLVDLKDARTPQSREKTVMRARRRYSHDALRRAGQTLAGCCELPVRSKTADRGDASDHDDVAHLGEAGRIRSSLGSTRALNKARMNAPACFQPPMSFSGSIVTQSVAKSRTTATGVSAICRGATGLPVLPRVRLRLSRTSRWCA